LQPFLEEITALIQNKENPLKPKTAFEVLCERHQLHSRVSYSSFKRFVKKNYIVISPERSTCRIEVNPGSEVQFDYAKMGLLLDPRLGKRKTVYAFIATLSYSRHKYVEFVYSQNQQSFVASHVNMFEYFDGVVDRLVLDNLKTGILKPSLYDPTLNRSYRELAEHYHCFIDPCRVARPKDKGKVERDVQTVREQFRKILALNPSVDIRSANRGIKDWCINQYGQREHGTTQMKPYPTFLYQEKQHLKPLPAEPFVIAQWKEALVHPDHYVQFNKKAFSVPTSYIGEQVWVKATHKLLQVFHNDTLIKQHIITDNYRHTDWHDFPENVQAALDGGLPLHLQQRAAKVGPLFRQLIRNVLSPHAFLNLRKAQGIVSLADKWSAELLEQAAAYALDHHISVTPMNFKKLLQNLQKKTHMSTQLTLSEQTRSFVRDMDYFIQTPTKE
jgi:transposase